MCAVCVIEGPWCMLFFLPSRWRQSGLWGLCGADGSQNACWDRRHDRSQRIKGCFQRGLHFELPVTCMYIFPNSKSFCSVLLCLFCFVVWLWRRWSDQPGRAERSHEEADGRAAQPPRDWRDPAGRRPQWRWTGGFWRWVRIIDYVKMWLHFCLLFWNQNLSFTGDSTSKKQEKDAILDPESAPPWSRIVLF